MKQKTLALSGLVAAALFASTQAGAWGLPAGIPGVGASASASSSVDAGAVVKNTFEALQSFTLAQQNLAQALGTYNAFAANKKTLDDMKGATPDKNNIETLVTMNQATGAFIAAQVKDNAKLDGKQKAQAAEASLQYVNGLSKSAGILSSIQDLAKNPTSLGLNANTVLYAAKSMPTVVSSGATTTSALIDYLKANGVETKAIVQAQASMGK